MAPADDSELFAIHESLDQLEAEDPKGAELVKLKYFVGLNWEEISEVKGIPSRTLRAKSGKLDPEFAEGEFSVRQITNRSRILGLAAS